MAKKFLTSIDLLKNELQNGVFQNLSVAPANPKEGQFYFNTASHKFCVYENGKWNSFNSIEEISAALALKADKADTYTKTEVNSELAKKANVATTLEGYGITDAYTKTEVDTELAKKANSATTLTGYGITDAYTKSEVDAKVSSVYRFKGSVATYEELPTENLVEGDVYNVESDGANYAWVAPAGAEEGHWDKLGADIDLTPYLTKELAASTYETIANVAAIKSELEQKINDVEATVSSAATHKKVVLNDELTPAGGVATWSIAHNFGDDVNVTVKEMATGDEVMVDVIQGHNALTIKINAESVIAPNSYKVVLVG